MCVCICKGKQKYKLPYLEPFAVAGKLVDTSSHFSKAPTNKKHHANSHPHRTGQTCGSYLYSPMELLCVGDRGCLLSWPH